jgi:aspartate/methionine/tyrosine aminotransferase
MSGWRMGLVASNPQFIEWILRVKSNIDSGMFRPMMVAAAEALKNTEEWHREKNIEVYAKRRVIAEKIMQQMGCTFDPKQVGMFLWGKIPDRYKDAGELADKVLYNANVFVTPGFIFGDKGNRYVRLSLCATEKMLEESLNRISAVIND